MERCKLAITQWVGITQLFPIRAQCIVEDLVTKVLADKTDLRPFIYQLLANMAKDPTVALQLIQAEPIRNLLLDFASETTHDARMEKHVFVKNLIRNEAGIARQVLDDKAYSLLDTYVSKGPYGLVVQDAKVQVAKESAN